MEMSQLTELETMRALIHADRIPDDIRKTATWCLDRLPGLYSDFCRTYEIRYGDEIRRLVAGLLSKLGDVALKQVVLDQLIAMHERLGIPHLHFVLRPRRAG